MQLRFDVGDKVQAKVQGETQDEDGSWVNGTILKQWERGNPYRIELDDEESTNVYGPVDEDDYVRAPEGFEEEKEYDEAKA